MKTLGHLLFRIYLPLLLFMAFASFSYAQAVNAGKLQVMVQQAIQKAAPASVYMSDYDTVAKRNTGSRFSGVVVSKDGLILSAAHVVQPGKTYQIIFPDGKECIAVGLGRMQQFDAAMAKIVTPGEWPFAEVGWASSLKINEPCISIAYPGTFKPKRLDVRFGYVAEVQDSRRKMIRSTCLMEPGDSGGPLFDMYGRVIGLHSNINMGLDANFEASIDNFRKYWTALQKLQDYRTLPAEEPVPADPLLNERIWFPVINTLETSLAKAEDKLDDYTVQLVNASDSSIAVATSFKPGAALKGIFKGKSLLITKNSLLQGEVKARLAGGKTETVTVLYRDEKNDLALLAIRAKMKAAIDLSKLRNDTLVNAQLGTFLITPHPENDGEISIISALQMKLPSTYNIGFFGSTIALNDGKNTITVVQAKSPAAAAGLKIGDQIVSINSTAIQVPENFTGEIQKNKPDDVVKLVYIRDGEQKTIDIRLARRPMAASNHVAERFLDGKSERRDGFDGVFAHDGKIKPAECGGPVFDLKGNFMGLNQARLSRTISLAVLPKEITAFVREAADTLTNLR